MKKYLLIMTLGLIGCGQSKLESSTSEELIIDTISTAKFSPNYLDSLSPFDKSVYKKYINKTAFVLMETELPDWKLPDPSNWERFWFKEYMKDGALVNYISEDFNCDNITDYCLLLQNSKKEFAVWVLQSHDDKYSTIKLWDIGKPISQLEIGINIVPKGSLFYIDFENDKPPTLSIKCPGIQIISFEKAASTYYWEYDQFKSVISGD